MKDKERIFKVAREKVTVTYKGVPIRLSADFSKETWQARRGWKEVFKVMKGKDPHPRLLYLAKLSFRMEGQIKCFPDKAKLKEFITTNPLLYEMLKGLNLRKRRRSKLWIVKWQQTHNYQQLSLNKNKLSKQLEQEQNHRNGDHMEGYQQGGGGRRMGGEVQWVRNINGRYKIDRGRLRTV